MDDTTCEPARTVALLSGGESAEREISLASGDQAEQALYQAGYDCQRFDPANIALAAIDWPSFDVCFIALHGGAGEDGRVQQQLERFRVPYTGSGPAASRLAMNKAAAKLRFAQCDVPTPRGVQFAATERSVEIDAALCARLERLGFPLLIKPQSQGSSLGVALANSRHELERAIGIAAEFDRQLMAEPFLEGREFTVAMLGRRPLPIIEVVAPCKVFTYDAKYTSEKTQYRFETDLPSAARNRLASIAVAAAEALGTAGLSRVDLMLDDRGEVWVLEVNTIPGLTEHSLAPRAASAAGMEMPELVDWMVRDAVRRHRSMFAQMELPT